MENKTTQVAFTGRQLEYLKAILERAELRGAEVPAFLDLIKPLNEALGPQADQADTSSS